MTDNEILDVLEHCVNNNDCEGCQFRTNARLRIKYIPEYALKIIKKQKAEIEKLNNITVQMDDFARSICDIRISKFKTITDSEDLLTYIEDKKRKAVEVFAEKVKGLFNTDYHLDRYYRNAIDELVKEMVGEKQ